MHKIQECFRNRVKQARRKLQRKGDLEEDSSAPKRPRKSGHKDHLFRRYPVTPSDSLDDPRSIDEHCKGMCAEMKKGSPRDHLLLPLLKSTYNSRRMYVEFDADADVRSTLAAYPALHRPAAVSEVLIFFSIFSPVYLWNRGPSYPSVL